MNDIQETGTPTVEPDFTAETQEVNSKFTQEDIDRIVKERLVRERSKILKQYEWLKESGFEFEASSPMIIKIDANTLYEKITQQIDETIKRSFQELDQIFILTQKTIEENYLEKITLVETSILSRETLYDSLGEVEYLSKDEKPTSLTD